MSSLGTAEVPQQLAHTVPLCEVVIDTLAPSEYSLHQDTGLWLVEHVQTVFRQGGRLEYCTAWCVWLAHWSEGLVVRGSLLLRGWAKRILVTSDNIFQVNPSHCSLPVVGVGGRGPGTPAQTEGRSLGGWGPGCTCSAVPVRGC